MGTREQPSEPEPPSSLAEHVYLGFGVAALSTAIALCAVDQLTAQDFSRGMYSILVGLFVVGLGGWTVLCGQARGRRQGARQHGEVMAEIEDLRSLVLRQRTVYLPAPGRQGNLYVPGGQAEAVPSPPAKVDDREVAIEEGFELGYRAKEAELKTTRLPAQKRRLMGDK